MKQKLIAATTIAALTLTTLAPAAFANHKHKNKHHQNKSKFNFSQRIDVRQQGNKNQSIVNTIFSIGGGSWGIPSVNISQIQDNSTSRRFHHW